ncbi:MAG: protein kinase, partial [Microcystis sp. M53601_WE4]|nr:protein kinase [Microcystis sp. M53601_WE4]
VATGKVLRTLTGHSDWVWSVVYSPDGRYLASGSYQTIKIWEVATGKELRTLTGHSHSVKSVVYSPDGRYLASGSGDKTIKIWRVGQ